MPLIGVGAGADARGGRDAQVNRIAGAVGLIIQEADQAHGVAGGLTDGQDQDVHGDGLGQIDHGVQDAVGAPAGEAAIEPDPFAGAQAIELPGDAVGIRSPRPR